MGVEDLQKKLDVAVAKLKKLETSSTEIGRGVDRNSQKAKQLRDTISLLRNRIERAKTQDKDAKQVVARYLAAELNLAGISDCVSHLHQKLAPLFSENHLKITGDRGILVEFARLDPDQYIKLQWTKGYESVPTSNMLCKVLIVPGSTGSSAWQDLSVRSGNASGVDQELKENGVTPPRKQAGLTPEKAVASVIKWFTANAQKLRGD